MHTRRLGDKTWDEVLEKWTPLPARELKVKTNTTFLNGKAGIGLVIRNEAGELVMLK